MLMVWHEEPVIESPQNQSAFLIWRPPRSARLSGQLAQGARKFRLHQGLSKHPDVLA